MSKYTDAADALKRAAVKYEALHSAAKVLEEIGSLEQVAAEALKAKGAAIAELDGVKKQIEAQQAKAIEIEQWNNGLLASGAEQAEILRAEARKRAEEEAAEIIKDAQDGSAKMVAQAVNERTRLQAEISAAREQLEVIGAEIVAAQSRAEEMAKAADAAEVRLKKVQDQIRKLAEA